MIKRYGIGRRALLTAGTAGFATLFHRLGYAADAYPNRPIKLIVPFAAGSSSDISARRVSESMARALGQPFAIENIGGAGGIVGIQKVLKQPADGYTLLAGTIGTHAINVGMYSSLPYDPIKSFEPISRISSFPNILVVHPSLNVKNLRELIALVKSRASAGSPLTYASGGNGTTSHLGGEQLKLAAQADITHIPYTSMAAALPDLLAGRVAMVFGSMPVVQSHVDSGSLIAIANTGATRSAVMPNVPTVKEQGYESLELWSWIALFAPAGTPKAVVNLLNASVRDAVKTPEVQESFRLLGTTADSDPSPEAFRTFIQSEIKKWVAIVKTAKIHAD